MPAFRHAPFKVLLTLTLWKDEAFRARVTAVKKKAKVDATAWQLHPDLERFLVEHPLDDAFCASVKSIGWPDMKALSALAPGFDGEDSPLPRITSMADIDQLPNLEEIVWPEPGPVPADAIPAHPKLRRVTVPTDHHTPRGMAKNDAIVAALVARGFRVVSRQDFGQTVLER